MLKRTLIFFLLFIAVMPTQAVMRDQYAMVFFFDSRCPICHKFAPRFKQLTAAYQLQSYVFSIDGQPINEYPVPIPSTNEVSAMFFENPRSITVPATFLINVNSRKFVKVSIGDVSYAELEQSVNGILNDDEVLEAIR